MLNRCGFRVLSFFLATAVGPLLAQEPLHTRIDRMIDAAAVSSATAVCTDGEFLRRAMLDLLGVVPTAAEAKAFFEDPAPNKRELLIDRLLADPRHPLHMAAAFHVMWMERRPDKHVPAAEWLKYLQDAFRKNQPYDELVRELLSADSANPATRPAAKFLLDRDADPYLLTRDIGRMFFGVDMQCAQCHDHPLIDDYYQTDYYGLFAFVSRTSLFLDTKDKNKAYLAEKADGVVEFKSVFTGNSGKTRPRILGGLELEEPRFRLGEEYAVFPAQNVRPVPKFSRRALLATSLADGTNPAFRRNIVNRLWAQLMGRGLVHPVDLHHSGNPPSHPDVLNVLADEIHATKFNLRAMLRELALTKAYQRTIDLPTEAAPPANWEAALASWKAEEDKFKAASDAAGTAHTQLLAQLTEASKALAPLEEAQAKADAAVVEAKKPYDAAVAALTKARQDHGAKQASLVTVTEAAAKTTEASKLLPGDAEVMQAVAVLQARVTKLTAEVEAANKAAADLMPPVEAALGPLNVARQAADATYAPLAEALKPIEAIKGQIVAAENQLKANLTLAQNAKKKSALLQAAAGYAAKKAALAAAEAALPATQAEHTAAKQALEAQTAEVARLTAVVTDSEKTRLAAQQQLESAKATIAAQQPTVQAVAEAIAKTESALAKLPEDANLKVALEKLKTRHEPLAKEFAALTQVMTTRAAEEQAAAAKLKAAQDAMTAGQAELAARQQLLTAKTAAVSQAVEKKSVEAAAWSDASAQLTTGWTADFTVRDLKPLSPEQMGWSILQATGIIDNYRVTSDAELEKTIPKASVEADPVQKANRQAQLEQLTREKLQGLVATFATVYGAAPGQPQDDFFATADQALFLSNGGTVRGWIVPGTGLFNRLNALADPAAFADELYLSVLTRRPTGPEIAAVANFLAARPTERPAMIQELAWALLASAEFRFQH